MDAITGLCLTVLVSRVGGSDRAGILAGLLYALNPTAWRFSAALLTEIPMAFIITLMALIFAHTTEPGAPAHRHWPMVLWLGALSGAAVLIKPNALLLPILLGACLKVRTGLPWRSWLASVGAIAGAAALMISPWWFRNWIVAGRPMLSSAFEDNLAHVSAVATLVHAQGEVIAPWTPRWEAIYTDLKLKAAERYGWPSELPLSARETDRRQQDLANLAREIIRQYPADFVLSHLGGFLRGWVPQEHRFWYEFISGQAWSDLNTAEGAAGQALARLRQAGPGPALQFLWQERLVKLPPLALALWAGWLIAYLASVLWLGRGSWRLRHRAAFLALAWASIFYFSFLPGPIAYVRFRVPIVPLLVAIMAVGALPHRAKSEGERL